MGHFNKNDISEATSMSGGLVVTEVGLGVQTTGSIPGQKPQSYQRVIYRCYPRESSFIFYVVTLTIGCIGLPLTVAAIFALYSLIRKDHVVPIYIMNILITDLIQLCCMIVLGQDVYKIICLAFIYIQEFGVGVNISFMVIVSLERYLMIAWPLWYKFKRNIKISVIVSVLVWLLPVLYLPVFVFANKYTELIIGCFLLLPFPLLIFFLGGTLKALSAARGVPPDEKRRIVAVLVLVLLIYTLLFLPRLVFSLSEKLRQYQHFEIVTGLPLYFNPLADLFLYFFMRKGICDKFLASLCRCKMDHDDVRTSVENGVMTHSDTPEQGGREEGQ